MTRDVRTLTISVEGGKLAVRSYGDPEKPTVLLVHGYPDTQAVRDGVVSELVDDYHVVTYDTRGIGASKGPLFKHGYTLDKLADDLYAVAEAVAPGEPVHLVGHDWGSIQAWEAATRPDSANRLLSYTSISGPSLDHAALWTRSGLKKPTPKAVARSLKQALASWYIVVFHLPIGPRVAWRLGLAKQWPRIIKAIEGTRLESALTLSRPVRARRTAASSGTSSSSSPGRAPASAGPPLSPSPRRAPTSSSPTSTRSRPRAPSNSSSCSARAPTPTRWTSPTPRRWRSSPTP